METPLACLGSNGRLFYVHFSFWNDRALTTVAMAKTMRGSPKKSMDFRAFAAAPAIIARHHRYLDEQHYFLDLRLLTIYGHMYCMSQPDGAGRT